MVGQAEQADAAVGAAKCLQPVEDGLAVVQDAAGGVEGERRIGLDTGVVPALPVFVVHQEHVVGEDIPERQGVIGGRLLRRGGPGDRDLVH